MSKKRSNIEGIITVLKMSEFSDVKKMIEDFVYSDDPCKRCVAAACKIGLDVLVSDEHYIVRKEVAKQGYKLEILINDPISDVRVEVAKQGFCLERLIGDDEWHVRLAVAEFGYRPDILCHDITGAVRKAAELKLCEIASPICYRLRTDSNFYDVQIAARKVNSIESCKEYDDAHTDNSCIILEKSEFSIKMEIYKFEIMKMIRDITYRLADTDRITRILQEIEL